MHPSDPQMSEEAKESSSTCSVEVILERSRSTRGACAARIWLDVSVRAASGTDVISESVTSQSRFAHP